MLREVPGVLDAAVIGVADARTGEAVVAYVVAHDADADALGRRRGRATPPYGWPASSSPPGSRSSTSCPLTVTGKVQKGRLRGLERRRALGLLE